VCIYTYTLKENCHEISHATLVATAVPLLLTSLRVSAGELHWSAAIGSGYARVPLSPTLAKPTRRAALFSWRIVSPHWTARIGTGTPEALTNSTLIPSSPLTSGTPAGSRSRSLDLEDRNGSRVRFDEPIMHASSDQRTVKQ